jgi:IS4 transposase
VVTTLSCNPQFVYDDLYVLRGDVENRTKELKLELKADRLSCHHFLANQFRLLLHTAAYCLFWLLRQHLQGTILETAQVNTLPPQALEDRRPHPGNQPPHLGPPGLGLSLP